MLLHTFSPLALHEGNTALITDLIGDWVIPRASMGDVAKD